MSTNTLFEEDAPSVAEGDRVDETDELEPNPSGTADASHAEPPDWPPPPPPPPTPLSPAARRPRGRWALGAAACVVAAALAGGGAGWLASNDSHNTTTTAAPAVQGQSTSMTLGSELDVAQVLDRVSNSVVTVQTSLVQQMGPYRTQGQAAGTGIILSADGLVLTNAHVVADATSITVTLPGESTPREAQLVGSDSTADIAVLKVSGVSGLTPAPLGDSSTVKVGDSVVAIGNALALEGGPTVTSGIISAVGRDIDVEGGTLSNLLQTDAAISSGNSGGPLVNAAGEVIGIDTAGASSSGQVTAENIGFAIPINTALQVAHQLEASSSASI
jgi:S1-C subfamily serine protease